ncbi:response regulator transcription factor [Bdellovibrionota bacterium FG-1]
MKKVLIIDDDIENGQLVADMLRDKFEALIATSGREGVSLAIRQQPDLLLLDVNMPEMDGFEVCKKLREHPNTRQLPIIMLTTASSLDSRVRGLDIGADDYITKPFQVRELVARVQARLRVHEAVRQAESVLELGNLKLEAKSFQVWVDSNAIKLTRIEFELLRYFIEHPNEVVDRHKLLGDLWPDAIVTNRTVDTHVANLRKKIRGFDHPLETIYGSGYILKTTA